MHTGLLGTVTVRGRVSASLASVRVRIRVGGVSGDFESHPTTGTTGTEQTTLMAVLVLIPPG